MKSTLAFVILLTSVSVKALTIGAYNIRNFDYDERYRISTDKVELSTMLNNLKADVLSVEEIANTPEFQNFISSKMPGYKASISECGGEHGQHLGFIYNSETIELLSFNEDLSLSIEGGCDSGSRPLAIGLFQVKTTKQKFYGMTAHLKSGSDSQALNKRAKQFELIKNIIKDLKEKTGVIDFYLAGDLNTTEYLSRGTDYKMLTKFLNDLGMIDLASDLKCSAYWWGGSDDNIEDPTLLDHVIVTPGLRTNSNKAVASGHCQKVSCRQSSVTDLGISYESVSDHCPLTVTVQ